MADKLKEIPKRILEWWNKFTAKQKTIMICIAAGVVLALAILVSVLTRPQYTLLVTAESTKEASTITELLEGSSLNYKVSDDGLQISILKDQLSDANLLLGANDIPVASYGIENVFSGGFSTTESDKQKRYKLYCEGRLEEDLTAYSFVKTANVQLSIPEDDGTLIAKEEESFASIILELDGEMPDEAPASIARVVATALGNDSTQNVTIIDTNGNLLFSGEDDFSIAGGATSQLSVKQQAENLVKNEVKKVLLGTNEFDNIEVGTNLSIDFSSKDVTQHDYTPADGQTQGVLSHEDVYNSEATNGTAGTPGTDSNTDTTTYVYEDNANSSNTVSEESRDYLPNETITSSSIPAGSIEYDNSSVSVAAIRYHVLKEEDARSQGLLADVSWDEYKAANGERTKIDADPDLITMVSRATGIGEANIAIVAYEEPMFVDKSSGGVKATDIVQIVLIVLILGLLAFVILRSMRAEKTEPEEEELSVENLLQSTPESGLEDIEVELKSQERQVIEKFVEDNPEAAANLLRNWLNEDWG
ncbi:MAG: flagellar basal-body MS-ring/collar protein FliF [Lachnospiraceae bacterium]|nr:flagellar basal-body MS-ring/collar protein FliF [Lachnospiraceae bacterium]